MTAYFKRNTISLPLPKFCWLEYRDSESDGFIDVDVYEVVYDDTEKSLTAKQIEAIENALERDPNCVKFVH